MNTALVPAALRSIASLSSKGLFPKHHNWSKLADTYAQTWEDKTLPFFEVTIPQTQAKSMVASYQDASSFAGPDQANSIDTDVVFHALSLDGYDNLTKVEVMNTDDCFRHFLLNTTDDAQLTPFLNQSASNIRRTFPAGLMTSAGMVVANPAFGDNPVYAQNFTAGAYHGTVIWGWQLAMMARGLEQQLGRCEGVSNTRDQAPAFCGDVSVYENVKTAYNTLWDTIEKNTAQLSQEVWSWVYSKGDFHATPLGVMPPPPGVGRQTGMLLAFPVLFLCFGFLGTLMLTILESNIRQLWSLSFLAVNRNKAYQ